MSKPIYIWSLELPRTPGMYWHRESLNHEEDIVEAFYEDGERELSIQYGDRAQDVVWALNWVGHSFAGPIPVPAEPISVTPSDRFDNGIRFNRNKTTTRARR